MNASGGQEIYYTAPSHATLKTQNAFVTNAVYRAALNCFS
jgi:hypothetical protein